MTYTVKEEMMTPLCHSIYGAILYTLQLDMTRYSDLDQVADWLEQS